MSPRALAALAFGIVAAGALPASAAPSVNECLDASEKGQELRDHGRLNRARELFTTCAAATCPAPVRASCSQWRDQVVESLPSIIVAARNEADEDVVGAVVAIDGTTQDQVNGRPIALDPGAHTITVSAAGYDRAEQKIMVNMGEKNRLVRVRVPRPGAVALPPALPTTSTEPPPRPAAASSAPPALAIGLGGAALAAIGTSVVLGLSTRSELDDLRASPCAATKTCDESTTDDLRTRFLIADVLLGVGIFAAGAAVYFWLTHGPSKTASARLAPFAPLRF